MSLPIVGAKFRPLALAILRVLPTDCPLIARPEPSNQFDPNAIQVLVLSSEIPPEARDDLHTHAQGFGWSAEAIFAQPEHHLGYIPAKIAALLAPQMAGEPVAGTLTFGVNGSPRISLPIGEEYSSL